MLGAGLLNEYETSPAGLSNCTGKIAHNSFYLRTYPWVFPQGYDVRHYQIGSGGPAAPFDRLI